MPTYAEIMDAADGLFKMPLTTEAETVRFLLVLANFAGLFLRTYRGPSLFRAKNNIGTLLPHFTRAFPALQRVLYAMLHTNILQIVSRFPDRTPFELRTRIYANFRLINSYARDFQLFELQDRLTFYRMVLRRLPLPDTATRIIYGICETRCFVESEYFYSLRHLFMCLESFLRSMRTLQEHIDVRKGRIPLRFFTRQGWDPIPYPREDDEDEKAKEEPLTDAEEYDENDEYDIDDDGDDD